MRKNLLKEKLAEGRVCFGGIVNGYSPEIVELFGAIGYDFVMIDCEHGAMGIDQVENMVRAAEVFDVTPLARVPDHADATILRFLDRGVQGIIVPHVNAASQATAIARAARYYPEGHRGVGGGRPHDYGTAGAREESGRWVNTQTMVIPMIEEVEAVNNLDDILRVDGVDMLHVAAGDLSQSMGYPSQETVWRTIDQVVTRAHAAGRLVSVGGNSPTGTTRVADLVRLGANAVTVGALPLLALAAREFRGKVEEAV